MEHGGFVEVRQIGTAGVALPGEREFTVSNIEIDEPEPIEEGVPENTLTDEDLDGVVGGGAVHAENLEE
jgi:hypothetical protein